MGQEEEVLAPSVDDVPGGVDCKDGVLGDGHISVHTISVVAEKRRIITFSLFTRKYFLLKVIYSFKAL